MTCPPKTEPPIEPEPEPQEPTTEEKAEIIKAAFRPQELPIMPSDENPQETPGGIEESSAEEPTIKQTTRK